MNRPEQLALAFFWGLITALLWALFMPSWLGALGIAALVLSGLLLIARALGLRS